MRAVYITTKGRSGCFELLDSYIVKTKAYKNAFFICMFIVLEVYLDRQEVQQSDANLDILIIQTK